MKALSNSRFSPILLDGKKERDKHLEKRRIKVGATFSKDALLIAPPHWLTLHLPKISVGVYAENHIGKGKGYGVGTANGDGRVDDPGISTADGDWGADDLGTSTVDKDKRVDDPDTGTANGDKKANNPGTGTADGDGRADNSGIGIEDADRANDLGTDTDKGADGQAAASNKFCVSFFSL